MRANESLFLAVFGRETHPAALLRMRFRFQAGDRGILFDGDFSAVNPLGS
jgi:hypothetical protein